MTKQKKTILPVVAVVIIGIVLGIIFSQNGSGKALRIQLDLGNKYLTDEEYEQAIIAFKKAIEIEPMSVEAYLGLVDAYVGNGDFETAISTLEDAIKFFEENGQDATVLKDKLTTVRMEQQVREEEERLAAYPFVAIQPILDAASDVWGRNWDEWTIDAFREKFNIQTFVEDDGRKCEASENEFIDGFIQSAIARTTPYYGIVEDLVGIPLLRENIVYSFGPLRSMEGIFSIRDIMIEEDSYTYSCTIIYPEYAKAKIKKGDLYDFALENGIKSVDTFISYLGLDGKVSEEEEFFFRTEYGLADIYIYKDRDSAVINFVDEQNKKEISAIGICIFEDHRDGIIYGQWVDLWLEKQK